MKKYYERQATGKRKLAEDNERDFVYASGTSGPFSEDQPGENVCNQTTKKKKRARNNKSKDKASSKQCPSCKLMGHSRISSQHCLMNPATVAHHAKMKEVSEAREKGTSYVPYET